MKRLFFLAMFLGLLSCQSNPIDKFKTVAVGDEKGQVLYKMGNPSRTYQKMDTTRWVYKLNSASGDILEREIWFKNGRVVFVDSVFQKLKNSQPSDYVEIN